MEFGTEPVPLSAILRSNWYQTQGKTINPSLVPVGISYRATYTGEQYIELGPLAFELITADLTPAPKERTVTDNPKKGAPC